jgi:glycosyltransferase involved in cell wall biosynthesis
MHDFDVKYDIKTKGNIYHGIDLSLFKPNQAVRNGRLLFVGRIAPEKNLDVAIAASVKSGVGLDIIGKVTEKNETYWQTLLPRIDGTHVRYLGVKTQQELLSYYASARALIFPSDINEPFGLVAIEAQACGTPVIMKRGGSRGELIRADVTGFLCDTDKDFAQAALDSEHVNATDCTAFAASFSLEKMAEGYDSLYKSLTS